MSELPALLPPAPLPPASRASPPLPPICSRLCAPLGPLAPRGPLSFWKGMGTSSPSFSSFSCLRSRAGREPCVMKALLAKHSAICDSARPSSPIALRKVEVFARLGVAISSRWWMATSPAHGLIGPPPCATSCIVCVMVCSAP